MKTFNVTFDIDDVVYGVSLLNWDKENGRYKSYEVEKYKIRNFSISCNSKREVKINYGAFLENNGKVCSYGFNFSEAEIGQCVFLNAKDADRYGKECVANIK